MANIEKEWTAADEAELRFLWESGATLSQIGALMKRSKNGIGAKARRMDLSERGTPIKPLAPGEIPKHVRNRPPLPSTVRTIPLLPSERLAMGVE